eukprot:6180534-Pleurochrysis_carterae.AAC.7
MAMAPLPPLAIAAEMGGMNRATKAHFRTMRELQYLLLNEPPDSAPGWSCVDLKVSPQTDELHGLRLIVPDVEMIERRADGDRIPIKAAIIQIDFAQGAMPARTVLFSGLVDPDIIDVNWASSEEMWDDKKDITGLSYKDLVKAKKRGEMTPLRDVQKVCSHRVAVPMIGVRTDAHMLASQLLHVINLHKPDYAHRSLDGLAAFHAQCVQDALHPMAFVAAHNLASDLKALRLYGASLRRRAIDTQAPSPRDVSLAPPEPRSPPSILFCCAANTPCIHDSERRSCAFETRLFKRGRGHSTVVGWQRRSAGNVQ